MRARHEHHRAVNANSDVLERMSTMAASDVGIPVVVMSELLYGAHRSARAEQNLNRVREYVARFDVLPADTVLFERYADCQSRPVGPGPTEERFRSSHRLHRARSQRDPRDARRFTEGQRDRRSCR
jgi:predicted nucleic acid-binding protein